MKQKQPLTTYIFLNLASWESTHNIFWTFLCHARIATCLSCCKTWRKSAVLLKLTLQVHDIWKSCFFHFGIFLDAETVEAISSPQLHMSQSAWHVPTPLHWNKSHPSCYPRLPWHACQSWKSYHKSFTTDKESISTSIPTQYINVWKEKDNGHFVWRLCANLHKKLIGMC